MKSMDHGSRGRSMVLLAGKKSSLSWLGGSFQNCSDYVRSFFKIKIS